MLKQKQFMLFGAIPSLLMKIAKVWTNIFCVEYSNNFGNK